MLVRWFPLVLIILAQLIRQYWFARWRLSSSSVVVCNAAGGRAERAGSRAADTPRWASTVTSR